MSFYGFRVTFRFGVTQQIHIGTTAQGWKKGQFPNMDRIDSVCPFEVTLLLSQSLVSVTYQKVSPTKIGRRTVHNPAPMLQQSLRDISCTFAHRDAHTVDTNFLASVMHILWCIVTHGDVNMIFVSVVVSLCKVCGRR